jgi:CubicO group peptidase (beta-lactamase class C family)
MKRRPIIILFTLVITATALALATQAKPDGKRQHVKAELSMPTVDKILDKHVRAIGGKNAYDKLTTRVAKGTIRIQTGKAAFTGSYEDYAEAPNKRVQFIRISLSNGTGYDTSHGFNGAIGWGAEIGSNGVRFNRLSGAKLVAAMREADFYSELKLKHLYSGLRLKGNKRIASRQFYIVEAIPEEGNPETLYFDTKTGLLARRDLEQINMAAVQPVAQTYYEDYKEVDGIMLPLTLRQVSPSNEIVIKITEVRHNAPIEEAKFKSPEFAVAALPASSVDEYIRGEMKKRRIPGLALVVIRDGEVVKMEGYGMATLEHDVPVTPDTVFELASVTKQFTAAAIMLLEEKGKLKLDDPIIKYLPNSPRKWKEITARHLLTHTACLAGLYEGFGSLLSKLDYSTADMFESATKDPMSCAPGERYQYSDVGYFLLGMIIEKASGQLYKDFMMDQFFKPLEMTATSVLDQWAIVKNRAAGYTIHNDKLVNIRRVQQVDLPSHFGIFSTVKDLAKWEKSLASGKVLKDSSLAAIWTPAKLKNGGRYPYGFGWNLGEKDGHKMISHGGYTGTEYTRFPDDKLTVIVLTNLGLDRGDEPVNSWGLTETVAEFYFSSMP